MRRIRLFRLPQPDSSDYFRLAGAASIVAWVGGTVLGKHPDGGLLGFSAGMFAVWSAMRNDRQQRDDREPPAPRPRARTRHHSQDREQEPSAHHRPPTDSAPEK